MKKNPYPPDYFESRYQRGVYMCRNRLYLLRDSRGKLTCVYAKRRGHAKKLLCYWDKQKEAKRATN